MTFKCSKCGKENEVDFEDFEYVYLVIDQRTNDGIDVFLQEENAKGKALFDLYWTVVRKDLL